MRFALALLIAASALAQAPGRARRSVGAEEVERVHRSALLIDGHNDLTGRTVRGFDIGPLSTATHTDLVRMKRGGMGAQFFAAFVSASFVKENRAAGRALEMIDTIRHDIAERYPDDFELATTAEGIRRARQRGKIAVLIGIEGGHAIENSLRLLRRFHGLGVSYLTLTHVNSNGWADSSSDANQPHNGLSPFGREVVAEMNRLGMMVDISHVSDKTFQDALETSRAPIFASHSSCRAISPSPRNLTDDMIRALAKKGGVIQINFDCSYLNPEALKVKGKARKASLADVVRHIHHAVSVGGVDAVGLGSDFDGVTCVPDGLAAVDQWPSLTRALLEEGYTAEEIRKIYGGNVLRLMEQVERVARLPR